MKKRKWWLIILLIVIVVLAIRLISQEEDWICVDGEWVKHGVPKAAKPDGYCLQGKVDNFKECIAKGNPAMESYPRQCMDGNQTFKEIIENFCIQEDVGDLCTTLYDPVCGFIEVQCVTTPCYPIPQTYSNSCFACQNENVLYWVPGECP